MRFQRRFSKDWEPTVLADRVLAEGTWWYQGVDEHSVRLLQRKWDYSSADIDAIEIAVAGTANDDYIDYAISDNGDVFFWELGREVVARLVLTFRRLKPPGTTSPLMPGQAKSGGMLKDNRKIERLVWVGTGSSQAVRREAVCPSDGHKKIG